MDGGRILGGEDNPDQMDAVSLLILRRETAAATISPALPR